MDRSSPEFRVPLTSIVLRALAAALLLAGAGCAQLPTGFSRTPSYALFDTGDTRIGRVVEPLTALTRNVCEP